MSEVNENSPLASKMELKNSLFIAKKAFSKQYIDHIYISHAHVQHDFNIEGADVHMTSVGAVICITRNPRMSIIVSLEITALLEEHFDYLNCKWFIFFWFSYK